MMAESDIALHGLEPWLLHNIPGFSGVERLTRLSGGQSNPTYRIEALSGSLVLRRKPFGQLLPSAHAIEREFRLLTALHPTGFPVARPFALCEDVSVIGAAFYVMSHVEGRVLHDATLPGVPVASRRAIYTTLIATLARLQTIQPSAIGLADFGRPGSYTGRQIERWLRQVALAKTADTPALEALGAALSRNVPAETATTLVHGDWRLDNLILAPDAPDVAAVIDWELATTGDPLADATYLLMNWSMPRDGRSGLSGVDLAAEGLPTRAEAVSIYCEATGRRTIDALEWYIAYNLFRLAAIYQGIDARVRAGTAGSSEAPKLIAAIPALIEKAWEELKAS